jgi:hypothetical protein
MHIYAFGSVCRGEISPDSDVDLLAVLDNFDSRFNPEAFSIYSYRRLKELWLEGNPFAWHLALESRLLFSSDNQDFLRALGQPNLYKHCVSDCEKFYSLFRDACASIELRVTSRVFDLSTVFLSIRNIATCFSLGVLNQPDFSRSSALRLGADSIQIQPGLYRVFERARILCTRGQGAEITNQEAYNAIQRFGEIDAWMKCLIEKAGKHARI